MSGPGRETPIVVNVPLTKGQTAKVDIADYPAVALYRWHAAWSKCTGTYYACRSIHNNGNGKRASMSMHRQIMGSPQGLQIDHIDHDTLNNSRANLRVATASQNRMNRSRNGRNRSGVTGVFWDKVNRKWVAEIGIDGRNKKLGRFTELEDAKAVRECAEHLLFGEFRSVAHV